MWTHRIKESDWGILLLYLKTRSEEVFLDL